MSEPAIGVNVGGTTTSVVLGYDDGRIVERRAWATQSADGEALYAAIVAAARELGSDASRVGVAIGGPMNARSGVIIAPPHLPGMRGLRLFDRLQADVGLPVRVHHDAAACALAENLWGADAGVAGLAYLTCGTGFGVGLVLDGRARYGSSGLSPEIGHIRYRDDGPDVFGKPGCFESFASASILPVLAQRYPAAVDENADAVGAACALLADLLVLDVIVLGSLATYLGEPWLERVRGRFARETLPEHAAACKLRAPSLSNVQDLSGLAAAFARHPSSPERSPREPSR